ncbi:MAG: hypothetical protein COB71_12585 [Thiotrichales bacterium]|nr:MAG: hypothetical protein COB71_12585 [Thiotrichales bacterium]
MWLLGDELPTDGGFFDVMAGAGEPTEISTLAMTGGQYIYTDGTGFWGSEGSDHYSDGGSMGHNQNWASYFDYAEANSWSYDINRSVL